MLCLQQTFFGRYSSCNDMQDRQLDTKVLMAWSKSMVVLAFRGTASLANAKSDLKASTQYAFSGRGCHPMQKYFSLICHASAYCSLRVNPHLWCQLFSLLADLHLAGA